MRTKHLILLIGISVQLTGCATIIDGTHQTVHIKTPPTSHAYCTLSNSKGHWKLRNTPGAVSVHRSSSALRVECNKAGYKAKTLYVNSHLKPEIAGNVIVGGFVGAGVDAVDGAAYGYPSNISVPLKKR